MKPIFLEKIIYKQRLARQSDDLNPVKFRLESFSTTRGMLVSAQNVRSFSPKKVHRLLAVKGH